ncbi:MAG: VOC family protein [Polyangiaceae bacterium]|jgi:catechol 2,3-dioxygenase-like lactoylglutathione lyase family enzyme
MPKTRRAADRPAKTQSLAAKKVPARTIGVRAQPLIAVRDVETSAQWYAQLLGVRDLGVNEHAHFYQRLLCDGSLILQLHAWDEEEHPNLVNADAAPVGHGALLWFEVDDFDAAVKRALSLKATVIEEPHVNPAPQHREMWLRDPDGYVVVIASPDGEAKGP